MRSLHERKPYTSCAKAMLWQFQHSPCIQRLCMAVTVAVQTIACALQTIAKPHKTFRGHNFHKTMEPQVHSSVKQPPLHPTGQLPMSQLLDPYSFMYGTSKAEDTRSIIHLAKALNFITLARTKTSILAASPNCLLRRSLHLYLHLNNLRLQGVNLN